MHSLIRWPLLYCLLVLITPGCNQQTPLQFASSDDAAKLPELHQANLSDGLLRLYGTPANPRMREVDEDAEEPEEGQPTPLKDVVTAKHMLHGARVYNARCAGCHGVTGDGKGPAGEFLRPKPRDYRRGEFKFTSTPYGSKPARQDLVRTIRRGAKGTSMPAFPWMSDEDLHAVIDYVIFLSRRGEVERDVFWTVYDGYEKEDEIDFVEFTDAIEYSVEAWSEAEFEVVQPVTAEPAYGEVTVQEGRRLFLSEGCSKCHGEDGKGQLEWWDPDFVAAQEVLPEANRVIKPDVWGELAPAADLTSRMLHGGRRPIDIYRRIYTGINGTPMPAFGDRFSEDPIRIWYLVHYVRHVIEGGDPAAGIETLPVEEEPGEVTAEESDSGITTGGEESDTVADESESDPVTDDSESDPATDDSESDPAADDSESDPAADDSESEPATDDSESDPATDDSESDTPDNADAE